MMNRLGFSALIIMLLLLTGCATLPSGRTTSSAAPQGPRLPRTTLASDLSIGYTIHGQQGSVNAMVMSDGHSQTRLVVLSPLGGTYLELIKRGDKVAVSYPSRSVSYQGTVTKGGAVATLASLVEWALSQELQPTLEGETRVFIEGHLRAKVLPGGQQVSYEQHELIGQVEIARSIVLSLPDGSRFALELREPQLNEPLPADAFASSQSGLPVVPLDTLERIL